MASLQIRSGAWRVIFRYQGSQHFVIIGEVEETEAQGVKARYEYLLRLLKQRLLTLPSGMDIVMNTIVRPPVVYGPRDTEMSCSPSDSWRKSTMNMRAMNFHDYMRPRSRSGANVIFVPR